MTDANLFNDIVLTETYDDMGEKIISNKQKLLIESLSCSKNLIYTVNRHDIIYTDLYGPVKLQSIGNEDRLFFPKSSAHVHVKWSQVCFARRITNADHPSDNDRHWIGIDFLTRNKESLFALWNLKPDQEFSDSVYAHIGSLL